MRRGAFLLILALLGAAPRAAQAMCGDLLVILDRSGSMVSCVIGGVSKESMAKKAINAVVDMFPSIPMALAVFPDTLATPPASCSADRAAGCSRGKVVVEMAADGGQQIKTFLTTMPASCGGTPTGDTMQLLKDYDKWTPGKEHFVLLITDGQPTCQDGEDGGNFDLTTQSCTPAPVCNGMGTCQCKKPTKVYDGVKVLAAKGIHTFVVGFEGMGVGTGCADGMPFDPNVLNMVAELGLEPQAPPAMTKYYSATNETTLSEALKKILGKVGSGTGGGCIKMPDAGASGGEGGGDPGSGGGSGAAPGNGGSAGTNGQGGMAGGDEDPDPPAVTPKPNNPSCACRLGEGGGEGGPAVIAAVLWGAAARRRRRLGCRAR